jgi:hypothetical protein
MGHDLHHIVLTHPGKETLVSDRGRASQFVHEPVTTTVIYDSKSMFSEEAFRVGRLDA